MYGSKETTDPSTGTKGFKYVGKETVTIGNFQKAQLTFYPEKSTVTFKSDEVLGVQREIYFIIDTYEDLADHKNGSPVAISCLTGRRKFTLCVESNSLTLKEGELPDKIQSETSEFMFYRRDSGVDETKNKITYSSFESSVKSRFFLGVSEDGENLILKSYTEDDKSTTFSLETSMVTLGYKPFELKEKIPYRIQNSHDDVLIAHPTESIATFESDGGAKGEHATFYVNMYKDLGGNNGVPVIFSCKVGNKNYLLSAASKSVIIKESELPNEIPTKTSEFIFYIIEFTTGQETVRFESSLKVEPSLEQRLCLAWNKEDAKKQLILKPYDEGIINESINFFMLEK